ncbi:MAG: sigma-54-dependent Fis family transcriptional regulator [Myxococcales bacterium]|nr:sigma-54-dependent Fis family transcriptional regulator [Myxococcales bacterium]
MEFRVLIVDDEETYARSLMRLLARRGISVDHAATCADGRARAARRGYDLVLLDFLLPDGSGLDLIGPLRASRPESRREPPRVLMMTAFGTIENAVEAMRRGAFDYVTKSTAIDGIVERVLDARRVAQATPGELPGEEAVRAPGLLGESREIREARTRIVEVARAPDTTVLLAGESGTGKGVAARAIHALGARSGEPFVAIDCVALPATLAESELFGHEKGAFTGAERAKPGKLEMCGRGTVLLDEIGDMEIGLQGKLLRVLEERTFERVGGVKPQALAARVIAASHHDLAALTAEGRFRLDLFHRLSVFPIAIPPLRERGDDVVLLAEHFTRDFAARLGKPLHPLGKAVQDALRGYDFPGNVRELKNVIERAAILASGPEITVDLLPPRVLAGRQRAALLGSLPGEGGRTIRPVQPGSAGGLTVEFRPGTDTLDGLERRLLEEALRMADGKKGRAAELLGISRFALLRRVEKYRL